MRLPLMLNKTIASAVLDWGLNLDPSLRWKARGLSGHDEHRDGDARALVEAHEETIAAIRDAEQIDKIPTSSFEIYKRAMSFSEMIRDGGDLCDQVFMGKVFNFVIGIQRSGGTYLMKQILQANNIDIYSLPMPLILDDTPSVRILLAANNNADNNLQCLYQFLQFLAISEVAFHNKPIIVNKNIFLGHWLHHVDALIGKQSNYIITIRNPFECFISFLEFGISLEANKSVKFDMPVSALIEKLGSRIKISADETSGGSLFTAVNNFKFISVEEWDSLTAWKQFLLYWESYYSIIPRQLPLKGNTIPVVYGTAFKEVVDQLTPKTNNQVEVNIVSRERNYTKLIDQFGFRADDLSSAHERVTREWRLVGMEFPALDSIQTTI